MGRLKNSHQAVLSQKGFTLIELMTVLMIVAIFMSMAMPAYRSFLVKNHRDKMKSFLVTEASAMEKWRARQLNYGGYTPESVSLESDKISYYYPKGSSAWYKVQLQTVTGSPATATPLSTARVANNWAAVAIPQEVGLPYIGISSKGIQCESNDSTLTPQILLTTDKCGTGSKSW